MMVLQLSLHFATAAFFAWLANRVGLNPWRKAANKHWSEQARLLWPVRCTAALNLFLLPLSLAAIQKILFPAVPQWWLAGVFAAFLGALAGNYPCDRELFPRNDFSAWRNQVLAGWGIRFAMWGLLVLACCLMPVEPGWKMLLVAASYLALHFSLQWGLMLRYLRLVRFLRGADERLRSIVDASAGAAGVHVRAVWVLEGQLALAYAFPITRELVFSRRLMEICTDDEVAAICSHELAHLKEGRAVLAGRLLGSLSLFPIIFIGPLFHALGLAGLLLPYAFMFAVLWFSRRLSRRMEQCADRAATVSQSHIGVYAAALEKLYRENKIPAVGAGNRQTHPHLYDRMVDAGVQPDYPRPAKPLRLTAIGWAYLLISALSFAIWALAG